MSSIDFLIISMIRVLCRWIKILQFLKICRIISEWLLNLKLLGSILFSKTFWTLSWIFHLKMKGILGIQWISRKMKALLEGPVWWQISLPWDLINNNNNARSLYNRIKCIELQPYSLVPLVEVMDRSIHMLCKTRWVRYTPVRPHHCRSQLMTEYLHDIPRWLERKPLENLYQWNQVKETKRSTKMWMRSSIISFLIPTQRIALQEELQKEITTLQCSINRTPADLLKKVMKILRERSLHRI